jgi:hypothetical protein
MTKEVRLMSYTPQLFVITNESTVLTDAEVAAVVPAMQEQVSGEFAQVWRTATKLEFVPKEDLSTVPATAWQMIVLDSSDQAGALGYHEISSTGQPLGKVFAKSDITYGTSWTVTMSHELLEAIVDPFCLLTASYQLNDGSLVVATVEVGDAVEDDSCGYLIGDVLVSDWSTPAWWGLANGTVYDFKHHATQPFDPANPASTIPSGGYLAVWTQAGGWSQVTGGDRVSDPQAVPAPGSRRDKRMRGQINWSLSLTPAEVDARRPLVVERLHSGR